MKKNYGTLVLLLVILVKILPAQQIPINFYGNNAWFTVYTDFVDDNQLVDGNDAFVNNIEKVKQSGAKFCRIGGANANIIGNGNFVPITNLQVLFLVKKIRAAGMEPIIQVPYPNTALNDNGNVNTWATNAGLLVEFINTTEVGNIPGGKVLNWIIANEPDQNTNDLGQKNGYNYNMTLTTSPANIALYIKKFAVEMRKKDLNTNTTTNPPIKIIGPELGEYSFHMFFGGFFTPINGTPQDFTGKGLIENNSVNDISGLITATEDPSGTVVGKPFIDVLSFHYYPPSDLGINNGIDPRISIISELHDMSDNWKTKQGLFLLKDACGKTAMMTKRTPSGGTAFPLKVAITEANLAVGGGAATGPQSFIGGQWWADFNAVCHSQSVEFINFWSSAEGDFGYMDPGGAKRSAYWHFYLMQEYFKSEPGFTSTFFPGTETQTNLKVFASNINTTKQCAVLIMNQDLSAHFKYNIDLAGVGVPAAGGTETPVSIDFSSAAISGMDQVPGIINEETTQLLIFNCNGKFEGMWEYNKADATAGTPPKWIEANPVPANTFALSFPGTSVFGSCQDFTLGGAANVSWLPLPGLTVKSGDGSLVELCPTGLTNQPTIYTYIATDANGCKITGKISATDGGPVVGTGGSTGWVCNIKHACNGMSNGSAEICDASGVVWSNGQPGNTATNLAPGFYTATFDNTKVMVEIKNIMQPTISLRQTTCSSVILSTQNQVTYHYGVPSVNYQWYRNGNAISGATTYSYSTSLPGNYYVTIQSSQITCNLTSPTLNVTNVSLTASATTGNIPCIGGVITLNGTSSRNIANYSWTGPNGFTSNVQNPSITNAQTNNAGTYVLTVASGGCVVSTNISVTVDAISVSPTASASSICQGSSTTLNANASGGTGTLSYLWFPASGVAYSASRFVASPNVTPSSSTNFIVRVTDSNGCFAVGTKAITVNNYQSAFTYPLGNYCASAGSTVLPALGQYTSLNGTFSRSPAGLNFVSNSTGEINLGTSSPGIYTITYSVPAANGCPANFTSANITINANDPSVIANAGLDKTVGKNCSATLNAGNYNPLNTYFWYIKGNPTPINSASAQSVVVYPGSTTTYVLKVARGCASFDEVKVNINSHIACYTKWNPIYYAAKCPASGSNGPKEYSGVLNSDLLIADDTIWVTGNLKITNNKRIDFSNSYVIIAAGAKIEVQPGAKLNIDHSVLQTCDGSMWKGIEVMSNYNDPTQLSIYNSLITNAEIAVKTDKATDIKISGSLFMNGNIGINLDRNKGFSITETEFNNYDIGIKTTKTLAGTSIIARNTFRSVRIAVSFDGDDHSKLIIACNNFDYKEYAMKSDNTMLKDQGTVTEGAGNTFSTVSNLPTNKLRHTNGNSVTYYYDPSNPIATSEMSAIVSASMDNSKCEIITARMMKAEDLAIIIENTSNFKLYPNPNSGVMNFDYQLADDRDATMFIYDVTGRIVSKYSLEHAKSTIDIKEGGLQEGVYFYEVIVDNKIVNTSKFVIIK